MRYSLYDINLISINEHNLHKIIIFCIFLCFWIKPKHFSLQWYICLLKIFVTFTNLIASRGLFSTLKIFKWTNYSENFKRTFCMITWWYENTDIVQTLGHVYVENCEHAQGLVCCAVLLLLYLAVMYGLYCVHLLMTISKCFSLIPDTCM